MNVEASRVETLPEPVPLDQIEVPPDRLRDADPDKVAEMKVSMRERGQLTPIQLLPRNPETGRYVLNIGLHRFMAAPDVGLSALRAEVFHGTAEEARLAEIDENLYRAELNPLDQAVFLAERRQIYESLHGLVRRGGDQRKSKPANLRQRSFFDDTTQQFGLSRNIIERALTRFNKLQPEVRRALRGTRTARIASEIDAISKLTPAIQFEVAKLLAGENPPKNVAAAVARVRGAEHRGLHMTKPISERLKALWSKADDAGKRAFIDWLKDEGVLKSDALKSIRGKQ